MLTHEELDVIRKLPDNVMRLNKWENEAWLILRLKYPGLVAFTDARHCALYLGSAYYQALMLELIRDATKLRLTE